MTSLTAGFALGLSLILAIGAQNAFVLRQGLRCAHVFWVCLLCAASDAVLIVAGVAGFGRIVGAAPWIVAVCTFGGAAFLVVYGALSLRAAVRGNAVMPVAGAATGSRRAALATCLALTWLNPHVYLDTVILLGSVASIYPDRWAFAAGAVLASGVFFFTLGFGARLVAPIFARPVAWRVLDVAVGGVMWTMAGALLFG